jgi:hypothetical protein
MAFPPTRSVVRSAHFWLAMVAAAFFVAQVVLVRDVALGWDESIYASQTDPRRPALAFTAPRARGTSWLVAPLQSLTGSLTALRVYLAVVASLCLYLGYAVWLRVIRGAAVPLGALLFASLWTTLFYGPSLMPNVIVALAGVFATGALLSAARSRSPAVLPWLGAAAVAVATLVRPGDVAPLVGALGAAVIVHRPWRQRAVPLLTPVVVGAVAGALPWIIEAEIRYDHTLLRIRRALGTQGTGERFVPDYQLRALDGPLLCRPCNRATQPVPPLGVALWVVGVALVVLALVLAVRRLTDSPVEATLLPVFVGAAGALPYLFLVGYAAPRFLLPAYALLALAAAQALTWLAAPAGRLRPVLALGVAVLVVGHVVVQGVWLERIIDSQAPARERYVRIAAALERHGVTPPCTLVGQESAPVAYVARCDQVRIGRPGDEEFTAADLQERIRSERFAVVLRRGEAPPDYARAWEQVPRRELPGGWRVFLAAQPAG